MLDFPTLERPKKAIVGRGGWGKPSEPMTPLINSVVLICIALEDWHTFLQLTSDRKRDTYKSVFTLESRLNHLQNFLEVVMSYFYHGGWAILRLLWSLSFLFGLVRMIDGVVADDQELFGYGLIFFLFGLSLGLIIRLATMFFSRHKKGG